LGKLIEIPSKKVLDYISIHGLPGGPLESGWRVTHHYADGTEEDSSFLFVDAEEMIRHIRKLTTDRLD